MNKLALLLAVGAATAAQAQTTYSYSGSPVAIPDSPDGNCGPAAYAEIYVPDTFAVGSVQVGFYVPHPFQGDLTISLVHVPTGREVVLVNRPGNPESLIGFGASNYGSPGGSFVVADSAAVTYDVPQIAVPGLPGVGGSWKPQSPLAAFNGESAWGAWRLVAHDCAGMDTGTIVNFSLTLGGQTACWANCDGSQNTPVLNIADLTCFIQKFSQGCNSPNCWANCDGSTATPYLNMQDFTCFLQKYAQGCNP